MELDDILIRKLLQVKFSYDYIENKHFYSSYFYQNDNQIVCGYFIENLNQQYIIPIIGMCDINSKKRMNEEYHSFYPLFNNLINRKKCRLFILIFEKLTNHYGTFIYPELITYI